MVLQGRCKAAKMNWTRVAQVHPKGVCTRLAASIARKIYASTACARSEARKIGEAPHPGPVAARQPRTQDLAAVSLFEPATDTLRSSAFENWVTAPIRRPEIAVSTASLFSNEASLRFVGRRGVAKALVKQGLPLVLRYDWKHDPAENLLHVQSSILALIEAGAFNSVGLAPCCASFSTAVAPRLGLRSS